MKDNRGFSLVELIICVAILSILLVFGFSQLGVVNSYRAREAVKKADTAINDCKVTTLSKSQATGLTLANVDVYLEFYKDANGYWIKLHEGTSSETIKQISKKRVKMTYKCDGTGSVETEVTESSPLRIGFNRTTGAFLAQADGTFVTSIKFYGGDNDYSIRLIPKTGKTMTKQQ